MAPSEPRMTSGIWSFPATEATQHLDGPLKAVLSGSEDMPKGTPTIKGYDFESSSGVTLDGLMGSFLKTGIQATALGRAVNEVNRMISWRLSDEPATTAPKVTSSEERAATRAKIFLGFSSNMMSAGTREHIKFLAKNKMVDVMVTSAGGIEEDFIKCFAPFYMGEYHLKGRDLHKRGINRTGNMLVPNNNYCAFEDWIKPILDTMLEEQKDGYLWTPSRMIARLGKEINNEDSVYYWAWHNNIPVYCPAITDGSIGDMLFFHSYSNPGLVLDIVQDVQAMNNETIKAAPRRLGAIILGGGLCKHHIMNASMMAGGVSFSVFINTAQAFDCSDSGADPDEAVSWGKISSEARPIKIHGDASVFFPLVISQTFAKTWEPLQLPANGYSKAANGHSKVANGHSKAANGHS